MTLDLRAARRAGDALDLAGCVYGPPHWQGTFVDEPFGYYALLAGLVKTQGLQQVVELGTHFGGATQAFVRGGAERVLTVDTTRLNDEVLGDIAAIERWTGDALEPEIVRGVMRALDGHADLLFVDVVHDYDVTYECLSVYANRTKPRFIVVDDVRLNAGMQRLWRDLQALDLGACHDVSAIADREGPGFGLIEMRYPAHLDERGVLERRAARALWELRRRAGRAVPEDIKARVREVLKR